MHKSNDNCVLESPTVMPQTKQEKIQPVASQEIYSTNNIISEQTSISSTSIKLKEQEDQYRELVESLNVGIFRTSSGNNILLKANTATATIFGYESVDEFMATSMYDHYQCPEQRQALIDMIRQDGHCKRIEVPMVKKDGTSIWVSFNATVKYKEDIDTDSKNIKWIDVVVEDITERKEAINELKKLNEAYERFVPHEFLRTLGKKSIEEVKLNDRIHKKMSILFSDIRKFCAFSESMTPEDNFKFINSYLSHMGPIVRQHHGFIDKFIGDSIMALFERSADDAVSAAIVMLRTLKDYNEGRKRAGYIPVQIGIGINTGPLMLGTLGEAHRMEGTVIGDAVNAASRLEKLTKHYKLPLLISENTLNELKEPSIYNIKPVGRVLVEGKSRPISVYQVSDEPL